ncbi:matrixin family metalloprotease [Niallia sp. Sow4_A1]|uniref:Matrixin family metalloprotease n=1 Tax=Niallia hominis TaxID=3133173 RepID=A0ABV1F1W7_9BACI|nr:MULTISPECIES: matrixin family metalloprotease [Bacillaceae]MCF2649871.1 matrixin family metalloprotease [Niallia circulans]MCM3364779.1 matrixin family metalloprotease [Niallia sp. MER TA 168]CAI9393603.1 hypothetical protein BACSP_03596 [Bacillus sp. T2.9-1]
MIQKMFSKSVLGLFALALIFGFVFTPVKASAHFLGYSSVDGKEIRWGTAKGSTSYTTARNAAIKTWNGITPIKILGDTASTVEDISFVDVTRSDVTWAGQYQRVTGADIIRLNKHYLSGYTAAKKQNVFTHELGHALGLAHSYSGEIMYYAATTKTSLGAHDKSDYHSLWGY